MPHSDTYVNFASLKAAESASAYSINSRDATSQVIVVAPHGGGIEPGTSELAMTIAGNDLSYYVFEGVKPADNGTLHLTSTNFDEPDGLALMKRAALVLTIHGEISNEEIVYMGGLNEPLRLTLRKALEGYGYSVQEHQKPDLQGLHKRNICNIGTNGAGIQLELSVGLRRSFFTSLSSAGRKKPTLRFYEFCQIVGKVIR